MRLPALARTTHKWLGLIIAVQAVFWTLSGLYMSAVHIDIIHGDRLVRPAPASEIALAGLVEPGHLFHLAPGLKSARLETQLGQPVYVVDAEGGRRCSTRGPARASRRWTRPARGPARRRCSPRRAKWSARGS